MIDAEGRVSGRAAGERPVSAIERAIETLTAGR